MLKSNAKQVYSYDLLRRYFDDALALRAWDVIQAAKLSKDGADLLVSALRNVNGSVQQNAIIDAVWDRHYRLLAEEIIQKRND